MGEVGGPAGAPVRGRLGQQPGGDGGEAGQLGIGLGLGAALALHRTIEGLLYRVSAADPLTYLGVAVLLLATAFLASLLPARRALAIAPYAALRHD